MVEQALDLLENLPGLRDTQRNNGASILVSKPFADLESFEQFDESITGVKEQLVRVLDADENFVLLGRN